MQYLRFPDLPLSQKTISPGKVQIKNKKQFTVLIKVRKSHKISAS